MSDSQAPAPEPRGTGVLAAAFSTFFGAAFFFVTIAIIHPMGVTTVQYLTFDAKSELELEVTAIILFAGLSVLTGGPLLCWIFLRLIGYRDSGATAWLTIPGVILVLAIGSRIEGLLPESNFTAIWYALPSLVAGGIARAAVNWLRSRAPDRAPA